MLQLIASIEKLPRPTPVQQRVVAVLVAADLAFIAANVALHLMRLVGFAVGKTWPDLLSITVDKSLAEAFNAGKFVLIVGLLLYACARRRAPVFLAAAAAYAYASLDDWFTLHERLGEAIAGAAGPEVLFGGVRWRDIGELAALGIPGAFFIGAIWLAARKHSPHEIAFGWLFAGMFAALGAFAALVDFMHQLIEGYSHWAGRVFAVVEDGGEMIVVSLTVGAAFAAYRYARPFGGFQPRPTRVQTGAFNGPAVRPRPFATSRR